MDGADVHAPVPALKRFERLPLVVPAEAVSSIFGKNAARAAPMFALAAFSVCSASTMWGGA